MSNALEAFSRQGNWYRGNLHLHTTRSDGEMSPEEAIDLYRGAGYHFLAITDHWRLTMPEFADDDFLLIPGEEVNGFDPATGMIWHLVGVFLEREVVRDWSAEEGRPVEWGIEALRSAGADVILAHPYWSGNLVPEILAMEGLVGLEIFNTTCQRKPGRGVSVVHWDGVWYKGGRLWGFAVDDTHRRRADAMAGWVMVKAEELTPQAVRSAIQAGHFYSSTGPEIHHIELSDGEVLVRCSPCAVVYAQSDRWMGDSVHARERGGELLTEVRLPVMREATYLRITCQDSAGNCAWSNPIPLR